MVIFKYRQSKRGTAVLADPALSRRRSQGPDLEGLTLTRVRYMYFRRRRRNDIMTTMTRDSTRYFALYVTSILFHLQ